MCLFNVVNRAPQEPNPWVLKARSTAPTTGLRLTRRLPRRDSVSSYHGSAALCASVSQSAIPATSPEPLGKVRKKLTNWHSRMVDWSQRANKKFTQHFHPSDQLCTQNAQQFTQNSEKTKLQVPFQKIPAKTTKWLNQRLRLLTSTWLFCRAGPRNTWLET